jgi:nitrogen-specific signal transduction histidine kinase
MIAFEDHFQMADTERRKVLELALSRQIMRLHGGTIRVQSEPGVRTTFRLSF